MDTCPFVLSPSKHRGGEVDEHDGGLPPILTFPRLSSRPLDSRFRGNDGVGKGGRGFPPSRPLGRYVGGDGLAEEADELLREA